jgi:hypothetical protein
MVLPFLLFTFLISIDFCRAFYAYTTITNAARNGALWASDPMANGTVTPSQSPYASVQAAALADAPTLNPALASSNIPTPTYSTDGHGNTTVVVTVNYTMSLMTSYLGLSSVAMSRQVTMRVEPQTTN